MFSSSFWAFNWMMPPAAPACFRDHITLFSLLPDLVHRNLLHWSSTFSFATQMSTWGQSWRTHAKDGRVLCNMYVCIRAFPTQKPPTWNHSRLLYKWKINVNSVKALKFGDLFVPVSSTFFCILLILSKKKKKKTSFIFFRKLFSLTIRI